jgi:hypothetical protein
MLLHSLCLVPRIESARDNRRNEHDNRAKFAQHSAKVNREVCSRDVQASSDWVVEVRARFRRKEQDRLNDD